MKPLMSLLSIIGLCSLIACSNSHKESSKTPVTKLPVSFEAEEFSLSEIATDLYFIPLSSDIPLPSIRQIACFDSIFCLLDDRNEKLYRFRFSGSFIDVLEKLGRGPQEYLGIWDFHVDKTGAIYVNSASNKKIFVYNHDLTYKTIIPYPKDLGYSYVRWLDSIMIFFPFDLGEVSQFDWVTTNYSGEIINTKLDQHKGRILNHLGSNSFFTYETDSVVYRYRNWSDTIFGIARHGANAKYVFNREFADGLRMRSLNEIFLEDMSHTQLNEATKWDGKRYINGIFDLRDRVIIAYGGEKSESVLFDPITNKSMIILDNNKGLARIPNDWLGSGTIDIRNIVTIGSDRYIVDYMNAIKIISIVKSKEFLVAKSTWPEKRKEFQLLGERLEEKDNPVLLLYKLK